jgi:hypothetical protein
MKKRCKTCEGITPVAFHPKAIMVNVIGRSSGLTLLNGLPVLQQWQEN